MAIAGQFQFRRDLASAWTTVNPILLDGELGIESDTDKFKIGDGVAAWNMLPYGGLKGDVGQASQTIVGATTVINPNQNPTVTDADAGPNADLRFSLPRAREVTAQTTNTVSPGTPASVTQTADAEGDVLLTFNVPRGASGWSPLLSVVTDGERRVLRLVDYVGGEGTKPTIPTDNYIGATGLTNLVNAVDIRGAVGATGPAGQSVAVLDEGTSLTTSATSINFTGGGITATNSGSNVTVNVPAASLPTPNTLALRDATGMADFSVVDVTEFFQNGVANGFVKKYGSGYTGSTVAGTVYNIARINFSAQAQHIVIRGNLSIFQVGARQISFIATIRANVADPNVKVIRYNTDESQFDLGSDLGSFVIYDDPASGNCYLALVGGNTASTGVSWSFESMERGNRQYIFMENTQTVLNTAGLTLIPVYDDPTGRVITEKLVAPRFTGNIVGDAATYGVAVALGAANAAGTALTFSRSDHVHAHGDQAGGTTHAAVTTTANGFMSAADKTKLDGIASGAQVNQNAFSVVTGNTGTATADTPSDTLSITGGTGISTAVTDTPDGLVITNTDTGSAARTAHEAAADPHPQYTTAAEASAAAPVQSVNGQTGNVTIASGTNNAAVTRTAPTASASTALTTIQSYPVAAGEITAGSEYEFTASLRVINTTTATNSVVTLSVGATNVLVLTQANGTTAAASPGAPVQVRGIITFLSATQAECQIHFAKSQAVAANIILNTSAPITVAAAGATTIDLKYNTSGTTATFICRQATIKRVK